MNKKFVSFVILSAASFAMHAYPFWMVMVFDLKHPIDFWRKSLSEVILNLFCAGLVALINFGVLRKYLRFQLPVLFALNVMNIVSGFQIYALMGLVVDAWSVLFSFLVKRSSKPGISK